MGRYLDAGAVQRLAATTHLTLAVYWYDDARLPADVRQARARLSAADALYLHPLNTASIGGYALLMDVYGQPALILRVDMPRTIYQQGQTMIRNTLAVLVGASLALGLAMLTLLDWVVLSRLARFNERVRSIRTNQDLSIRLAVNGQDEVAHLATSINRMLAALEHAQEEHRQSEARFQSLAEATFEAILVHDNGAILDVNQAAVDLFGFERAELIGHNALELLTPPGARALIADHIRRGDDRPYETEQRRKDGAIFPVETHAKTVSYQGRMVRVAAIRDITARKQTEEALLQAKTTAEFANLAKTTFLRSISHELRTPLNHILGFAHILDEQRCGALNPQQAQHVNAILSSAAHLLTLIEDILRLSQLDFGKDDLRLEPIPLKSFLEQSLKYLREKDLKQQLTLTINLPPELEAATLIADQDKLKQVLFQLLSNAVKFTPDGGAIILDTERHGAYIVISVVDPGIGIAPEEQEHIFAPFYQIQGGLASKTPGTGLGLTIARRLVELHGGKLRVSSEGPGKGSRFNFSLPQGPASQTEDALQPFDSPSAALHATDFLPATSADVAAEIVPPPQADLEAVYELAVLGKVFDIQTYAERLEASDARYRPFARKIRALAQAFEDQQIAALVKHYLEDTV